MSGRTIAWIAVALSLFGCHEPEEGPYSQGHGIVICPDGATLDGIDVSYWQGTVDWYAVANDGIDFAFVRVSDGLTYYDTEFQNNWAGTRNAGIVRGAYQYFRPGEDAVAQAELLLSEMGPLQPGDLPPVLDVETTDGYSSSHIVAAIHDWMDTVETEIGRMPIIYTGSWFWESSVGSSDFEDYPLWVANWFVSCPDTPDQWNHWEFWQTSAHGSVDGISGAVDTNVFNGDMAALLDFAEGSIECGDGICNGDETHETCPEDCPACEAVPAVGRTVDELEMCFTKGGDPQWWRTESDGWDGSLLWTHTTDSPDVDNYGIWDLDFDEAGRYLVEVYTAAPWAQSQQANYEVRHDGHTHFGLVDQGAVDGWNTVGEYDFAAGADQFVRLDDNTGEPYSGLTQIAFDAVRVTRLGAPGDDDDDDHAGDDDDVADDDDDDHGTDDDDDTDDTFRPQNVDDDDGCSCSADGSVTPSGALLAVLALVLVRRLSR